MASPRLSHEKSTRSALAMMGSNDLVVGENHMVSPNSTIAIYACIYYSVE